MPLAERHFARSLDAKRSRNPGPTSLTFGSFVPGSGWCTCSLRASDTAVSLASSRPAPWYGYCMNRTSRQPIYGSLRHQLGVMRHSLTFMPNNALPLASLSHIEAPSCRYSPQCCADEGQSQVSQNHRWTTGLDSPNGFSILAGANPSEGPPSRLPCSSPYYTSTCLKSSLTCTYDLMRWRTETRSWQRTHAITDIVSKLGSCQRSWYQEIRANSEDVTNPGVRRPTLRRMLRRTETTKRI